MIKKFDEFTFESKSTKNKEDNALLLIKLLNDKPTVKLPSRNEKGAYSLAGAKKYFRDNGKTNDQCDDAFYNLRKDKSNKMEVVSVKDHKYNESIPFYYMGLSKSEASSLKEDYEKDSLDKNKGHIEKKKETRRISSIDRAERKTRSKKSDLDPKRSTVKKKTDRKK
jgi:hypothetical protein